MKQFITDRLREFSDNSTPEGYKSTKAGVIPYEWSEMKLSQVLDKTKLGGNYENTNYSDGVPLIKMGNIGRGNIVLDNLNYIKSEEADCDDRLKEGDLLFNTRNTLELVGKVAIWRNELPEAYYNSNLLKLKFKDQFVGSNYFMNYQFNSFSMVRKLRRLATGTTSVAAIYTKDLTKLSIAIPPIPEQQKIAEILSTWDKAIELKEQIIEEKKKQKLGLMQKLLTGKVRLPGFEGEWERVRLGDLIKTKTKKTIENNQHEVLSCTKDGIVRQSEHFNKQIASENNIGYKIVNKSELVFSPMNLWLGGIDISSFEIGIVSPAYKVYSVDYSIIGENYLRNILRSEYMIQKYDAISQKGASVVRRNLNIRDFEDLEINIPIDKSEMSEIDRLIGLASKEVYLLEADLENLKLQKKGLMQLLLTGIMRVQC